MLPFLTHTLLRGERVYLDRVLRSDCAAMARWTHDMEYSRLLRRGEVFPSTAEEMEGWLFSDRQYEEEYFFAIRTVAENHLIGGAGLNRVMRQARHCMFWIGIGEPEYRGKGYGNEALKLLLQWCFLEMNLNRVGLEVMSYNERAIASYERMGFQHEGKQREMVIRDGVYYDILLMSILRREWEAGRQ
ncbi:MAG: GNAT family protein [Chloroflexota bacterium]|nr:GNAT family protein [Chloroflexota bacterium]